MGRKDLCAVGTNWIWEADSEEGREERLMMGVHMPAGRELTGIHLDMYT